MRQKGPVMILLLDLLCEILFEDLKKDYEIHPRSFQNNTFTETPVSTVADECAAVDIHISATVPRRREGRGHNVLPSLRPLALGLGPLADDLLMILKGSPPTIFDLVFVSRVHV